MKELTVKEQLLKAGMAINEIDNYCSDLCVKKNDISTKFVNSYEFKCNVTSFKSEIDGTIWYDLPFAYTEYHTNKKFFTK